MNFSELPKVELHLHLDCSVSYAVARRFRPGLSRSAYEEAFIAPPKCKDLADFLKRAVRGFELLQSEAALRQATLDLLGQLEAEHVLYAEIRFAPLLHTDGGLSPEAVVETVLAAIEEGTAAQQLEARLILCTLRRFSAAQSLATARLAHRYFGKGVAGFDIAGDEAAFPLGPHVPAFQWVHSKGIPATAHAGEAMGAESVLESLSKLHLKRMGHGVRSLEQQAAVDQLLAQGIHLEVCPTSNIQTDVYGTFRQHPINQLLEAGLPVSINTDGRALCNVSLSEEYQRIFEAFEWPAAQYQATLQSAIDAAFAPEPLKQRLSREIREKWRYGSSGEAGGSSASIYS